MSVNDTDEWASMIINELFDESKTVENIKKCASKDKKTEAESLITEVSHLDKDLSIYQSVNSIDYLPDYKDANSQKLEVCGHPSEINDEISGDFDKKDKDLTDTKPEKYKDILTTTQSIVSDYNWKPNIEEITIIDEIELVVEKKIDHETNNDSSVKVDDTKNLKEDLILIDFDEAFIQNEEMNMTKADKSGNNSEIWFSSDSECLHDRSNLESCNFLESRYKKKGKKSPMKIKSELSSCSYEKIDLNENSSISDKPDIINSTSNPVKGKTEFKIDQIFSVGEPASRSSQEHLDRIDEKIERLGFRNLQKGNSRNVGRNNRQIAPLTDLCYKRFVEKYIKEEMEYRWGSSDGFIGNENLTTNNSKPVTGDGFKSSNFGEDLKENTNNLPTRRKVENKLDQKNEPEANGNVVDAKLTNESASSGEVVASEEISFKKKEIFEQHKEKKSLVKEEPEEITILRQNDVTNKCFKRKRTALKENCENTDETFIDREHIYGTYNRKMKGINRLSDEYGEHQDNMHNKKRIVKRPTKTNPKRSIFTESEISTRNEANDRVTEDENKADYEELQIGDQRVNLIVTRYRDISAIFEAIFIRPFANVIADSYEFLSFIFFLAICVLCFLYTRIHFLISNHRLFSWKKLSNICKKKEDEIVVSEKPVLSIATSDESTSSEGVKDVKKISFKKDEILEQLKEKNSWLEVEPEEVMILSMNYEIVTENIRNLCETNVRSDFLSVNCRREQHRGTLVTDEHSMIDLQLISIDANQENEILFQDDYFDMEIIASSKELRSDLGETDILREIDNSHDLEENPEQYEENSVIEPVITEKSNDSLTEVLRSNFCGDVKPLLNSTEIDGFEREGIFKWQSSSHCENLPGLDIEYANDDLKMKGSPLFSLKKKYLNSSLSVNVSSLFSRSDDFSDTIPLLGEYFLEDENVEAAEDIKIPAVLQKSQFLTFPPSKVDNVSDNSLSVSVGDKVENLEDDTHDNSSENCFDEKPMILGSGGFEISSAVDVHFRNSEVPDRSFMSGDAQCISNLSDPIKELFKNEVDADEAKISPKRKNRGLRRRMSTILNNWKNRPSCMTKNLKCKKKGNT